MNIFILSTNPIEAAQQYNASISTIYCWKVNKVPMGEYNWNIGGISQKSVDHVSKKMKL